MTLAPSDAAAAVHISPAGSHENEEGEDVRPGAVEAKYGDNIVDQIKGNGQTPGLPPSPQLPVRGSLRRASADSGVDDTGFKTRSKLEPDAMVKAMREMLMASTEESRVNGGRGSAR